MSDTVFQALTPLILTIYEVGIIILILQTRPRAAKLPAMVIQLIRNRARI